MKKASEVTKKAKAKCVIFTILHILCLIGPFLYFVPYAFIVGEVASKLVLSMSLITSFILAGISFLVDFKHRAGLHKSIVWLMIAAILFCLTSVKSFIWIMAGVSLMDELIFCPIKGHYHRKHIINKEIDQRL